MQHTRMLRRPVVLRRTARSNASLYTDIQKGEFTKSVRIAGGSVGWPEHEVEAILRARTADYTPPMIRALVDRLHADRKRAMEEVEAELRPASDAA